MANQKLLGDQPDVPKLTAGEQVDAAVEMCDRARRTLKLAHAMALRAQAMSSEDQLCRDRMATVRGELATLQSSRTAAHVVNDQSRNPPLLRCAGCGFPLLPGENPERCHRCEDEDCEQAQTDWEMAQTRWDTAATDPISQGGVDAGGRSHVHGERGDWQAPAEAGERDLPAELEQSEVEWEQAQTAWREAQDAQQERLRRTSGTAKLPAFSPPASPGEPS